MYAREVGGRKLTFFVSGKLWGQSLVMGDQETGSEWSHILGEAKSGPMSGNKLTHIPSTITNWGTWRDMYPNTTVASLSRTSQEFTTRRLHDGSRFGVGLERNGESRLWRFDILEKEPLVHDQLDDLELVIYFDAESRSAFVWNRSFAGRRMTFHSDGTNVLDVETASQWDMRTGCATAGTLVGSQLTPVPVVVTFRSAWKRFHKDASVWLGQRPNTPGTD